MVGSNSLVIDCSWRFSRRWKSTYDMDRQIHRRRNHMAKPRRGHCGEQQVHLAQNWSCLSRFIARIESPLSEPTGPRSSRYGGNQSHNWSCKSKIWKWPQESVWLTLCQGWLYLNNCPTGGDDVAGAVPDPNLPIYAPKSKLWKGKDIDIKHETGEAKKR